MEGYVVKRLWIVVLTVLAVFLGAPARAAEPQEVQLIAWLSGAAEAPEGSGDPNAAGVAVLTVKPDNVLCYVLWIHDHVGRPNEAHVHKGAPGVDGSVGVIMQAPTYLNSVTACRQLTRSQADSLRFRPRDYYVNIHTTAFPAGAVRGQLDYQP
jgi:hypothetical protein